MGKSDPDRQQRGGASHQGIPARPVPDQHHLDYLAERLEPILQDLPSIRCELRDSQPGMTDQELMISRVHNKYAPRSVHRGLTQWLGEYFAPWAWKAVEAFGLDKFPTYFDEPELPPEYDPSPSNSLMLRLPEGADNPEHTMRVLASTDDDVQAGLRLILWAATYAEPALFGWDSPSYGRDHYRRVVDAWCEQLVVESDNGWGVYEQIADWVRSAFDALSRVANNEASKGPSVAGDTNDHGPTHASSRSQSQIRDLDKQSKRPTDNAVKAYRLKHYYEHQGETKTQTQLAEELSIQLGKPISQGQVSRWIDQVEEWIKVGNVLPDLEGFGGRPQSVDPKAIDMGRRREGRAPRQRVQRDED